MAAKPTKKTAASEVEPTPADEPTAALDGPNAAEAALADVTDAPLLVTFRDFEFKIEKEVLTSARFLLAIASDQPHRIIFEILGPEQAAIFIGLLTRGESILSVSAEFLPAVNKAAGWGNS